MKILKLIPLIIFTSMSLMASSVIMYKDESLNKLTNPIQYAQGLNAAIENNSGIEQAKNVILTPGDFGGNSNSNNSNSNQNNNQNADTTPPAITSLSTFSFDENLISNFQITATDNVSSNFGYVLGGVDSNYFTLDGNGIITFKAKPDFETKPMFNLNVIVKDEANNEANQDITININDIAEGTSCLGATPGSDILINGITYYVPSNKDDLKYKMVSQDPSKICTSNITDMSYLFYGKSSFSGDISGWDTSNVTNMEGMFQNSSINPDLSKWDVSSVTNMIVMFYNSEFNQDISNWDVSSVTNMISMFQQSQFNQPIGNWNTSSVIDMTNMFYGNTFFNQSLNGWNTSNVLIMSGMFNKSSSFNGDISSWNTSSVTKMNYMFSESSFNQPIGNWNVSNVIDMSKMFYITPFNKDLSGWNISKVENMEYMFANSSFNQPLNNWNVRNVKLMNWMFANSSFNNNISGWDLRGIAYHNINNMFYSASSFNQDLKSWCVSNIRYVDVMPNFSFGTQLTIENEPSWLETCPNP